MGRRRKTIKDMLVTLEEEIERREEALDATKGGKMKASSLVQKAWMSLTIAFVLLGYILQDELKRSHKIKAILLFAGYNLFMLAAYRSAGALYARSISGKEAHLRKLRLKQKENIEALRKETHYYETREIIAKYDEGARGRRERASPAEGGESARIMDKLAGLILGDSPKTMYSLVCEKCYTHNGLLHPDNRAEKFRCHSCHHLNCIATPTYSLARPSRGLPALAPASGAQREAECSEEEGLPKLQEILRKGGGKESPGAAPEKADRKKERAVREASIKSKLNK